MESNRTFAKPGLVFHRDFGSGRRKTAKFARSAAGIVVLFLPLAGAAAWAAAPTITGSNPAGGPVETTVAPAENEFPAMPEKTRAKAQGSAATVSTATTVQSTGSVPQGAPSGRIAVGANGKPAIGNSNLTVNPPGSTEMCGMDPRVKPNDPPGFVPITQLSGIVHTPGIEHDITNNGNLGVDVTSPGINATIADEMVDVAGTFAGPVNTGITVNGIVAATVDGHFLASGVPLTAGVNTLTVTATTLPGAVATTAIPVTRAGTPSSPVSFTVDASTGSSLPAPATIVFDVAVGTLPGNATLRSVALDADGDGASDFTAPSLVSLPTKFTYVRPGLYTATLRIASTNGSTYIARREVLIEDFAAQRAMLCDVYGYLKNRLNAQDAMGASNAFQPAMRSRYQAQFAKIGSQMPKVVPRLGVIVDGQIGAGYAFLTLVRDNPDHTRSGFPLRMTQGTDGVWRISEM